MEHLAQWFPTLLFRRGPSIKFFFASTVTPIRFFYTYYTNCMNKKLTYFVRTQRKKKDASDG